MRRPVSKRRREGRRGRTVRWILLLLVLALTGCTGVGSPTLPLPSTASQAEAAMKNRLDQLLETCLSAAKKAGTPTEAESLAQAAYLRWKQTERAESQFQVQAQRLSGGGIQLQLQAQLVDGAQSVQAQRQAVLPPAAS